MRYIKKPLSKEEVIKAIEFKSPERIPLMVHFWNYGNTSPYYNEELNKNIGKIPM